MGNEHDLKRFDATTSYILDNTYRLFKTAPSIRLPILVASFLSLDPIVDVDHSHRFRVEFSFNAYFISYGKIYNNKKKYRKILKVYLKDEKRG